MPAIAARTLLIAAVLIAAVGCSYDVSATFNSDGSVNVGLQFLLPKSLLEGGPNMSVSGFTDADIAKASAEVASKYPGAKVTKVTVGDEAGVLLTVPFKTEKDAFAFLTEPSKLNPNDTASSGSPTIDVGNTGGLFISATHTTSGQTDTYTFKTQAQPVPSPSPDTQVPITPDELSSVIQLTFSLTVPHEIASAPGALFTQDRKTAIWKLSLTQAQTLTATTDAGLALTGVSNRVFGQSQAALIGIGVAAIALAFFLGLITPWRLMHAPLVVPPVEPAPAAADSAPPPPPDPASMAPPSGGPEPPG